MKKVVKKAENKHRCGDCAHGEWVLDDPKHRDMNGEPLCLRCQYQKYYVLRSQAACEKYNKRR